ncbi:cuticle protein CP14.6 [Tribolium castaneum]|uniref:Adult-specific rigid cuticular protein 12.4-like Protein n=1 Tax=Tribolium castaneum TaxID=7070 RepID=A0A139WJT8_TRICA|nr:PREDICTED: cuticle protein CP14.6 [Tribolium castaneum]KYB28154.1 Adult-specific rigid cuticular protein 12.4-like Protein [Tribolium castaneum]|eukprot:XP_001809578.1 PREDICTED: cuticle protein CP14.6 [Tribolium castaneum]
MKFLVFALGLLVASAAAKPANPHVAVTQDTAGNYNLALNTAQHSRTEQANADGSLRGSYTYTGADGVQRTVEYSSGPEGFQANGAHLPVPPQDTDEVAKARALHLASLAGQ